MDASDYSFMVYNPEKNIFIFSGHSASGKSFLANSLVGFVRIFDDVTEYNHDTVVSIVSAVKRHPKLVQVLITNNKQVALEYWSAIKDEYKKEQDE